MKRFRALLFDVDGTLSETEELHRRAFNESFEYFGLPWSWDVTTYRRLLQVTGGKERIRYFIDRCTTAEIAYSDDQIAILHRFKTACYERLIETGRCGLRPGVADLIQTAKSRNQLLAIVTTTTRRNVEVLLRSTLGRSWTSYFAALVCGEDVRHKKPAADAYLKVLDRLGLPAPLCLAVEDSRNGLMAARSAGIPVLITRSLYFSEDDFTGAVQVVGNLTELRDFALTADVLAVSNIKGSTSQHVRPVEPGKERRL